MHTALKHFFAGIFLLSGFSSAAQYAAVWDVEALCRAPAYRKSNRDTVAMVYYQGLPYRGKATEVFAYYATPGTLSGDTAKDARLPAVVLVHGGGGTAFREWVSLWARKGYAAIAIDWRGNGPDGTHLPNGGPEHEPATVALPADANPEDSWPYHAVADILLAHSLIRSFPEVDSSRTVITGISWGGYLTSMVSGIDPRFKAAIPVYGCGFIYQYDAWDPYLQMPPDLKRKWIACFDPSAYLPKATMPVLFVNGTNDHWYPVDIWSASHGLVRNKNLSLKVDMKHSHEHGWEPGEIYAFADTYTRNSAPLPRLGAVKARKGKATAALTAAVPIRTAHIHYTRDTSRVWEQRKWETAAGVLRRNKASVSVPAGATAWFISVTDQRGLSVSSEIQPSPVTFAGRAAMGHKQ